MNKIVSIKNTSAIFLAIVLIAGTIALSPTFFMVETAQASSDHEKDYNKYDNRKSYEQDRYDDDRKSYGKDNHSYKSKDSSSITVKKIKCNNINVNLNGFNGIDVNAVPPALNGLATDEAQASDEDEIGASSSGNGGGMDGRSSGSDNDFRFVCIDNNNFHVAANEPTPEPPSPPPCDVTVDTITGLGLRPLGVAYDDDKERMYVTNQNDGTVSVIDTATNTVIDTIEEVGLAPTGIAYDTENEIIYVALQSSFPGTVSVIDTATNTVIDTITVGGGPIFIAYDDDKERMYVTNLFDFRYCFCN